MELSDIISIFASEYVKYINMKTRQSHNLAVLIALLVTMVLSTPLKAQNNQGWVIMVFQNAEGDSLELPMSEIGSLVAVDDAYDFSILSTTGSVLAEGVMKVSFEQKGTSDIVSVKDSGNLIARTVSDKLTLIGVQGEVSVYDAGGKLQLQVTAKGGETVVGTSSLPNGVYVVKVGKQTFKFMKK